MYTTCCICKYNTPHHTKHHTTHPHTTTQEFIDFCVTLYSNMDATVTLNFLPCLASQIPAEYKGVENNQALQEAIEMVWALYECVREYLFTREIMYCCETK
jgi:hypothetical protein